MSNNTQKPANIKYIGIDDGHSGTKVFAGYDPANKKPIQMVIESVVVKGPVSLTQYDQNELNESTIIIDGKEYITGSKFAGSGDDLVHDGYPTSDQNVALITQALRQISQPWSKEPTNISIVTGLPLGHYFDKTTNKPNLPLINAKKDNVARLQTSYSPADAEPRLFNIIRNSVQPEGWGSMLDAIFTDKGEATERHDIIKDYGAVIIDIGGRTVDTMIIQPELMSAAYEDIYTYDLGILFMHRRLIDELSTRRKISREPRRVEIDRLIETGGFGRDRVDYSDLVNKIKERHAQDIFDRIKSVISSAEAEGGIILTGGGAELLGDILKQMILDYLPNAEVIIPVDPVFSNARGFWKVSYLKR